MFRNTYLQAYKNQTASKVTLEELLCHFSYIYATMGSVLQDIEYQIGKLISVSSVQAQPQQKNLLFEKLSQKVNQENTKVKQTKSGPEIKMEWISDSQKCTINKKQKEEPRNIVNSGHNLSTFSFEQLFGKQGQKNKPQKPKENKKKIDQPRFVSPLPTQNEQDFMDQLFERKKRGL